MTARRRHKTSHPPKHTNRKVIIFLMLVPVLLFTLLVIQQRQNLYQHAAESILLDDNFNAYPVEKWTEGTTNGNWKVEFHGYGTVGIEGNESSVLYQKPKASIDSGETHASLITSTRSFGELDLSLRMRTVKQLRTPAPNSWETAWVFWNYTDNTHFYYLALKTNGWELGKEDPAYPGNQRFLATGSNPSFVVGKWYDVRIAQQRNIITVIVNGNTLTSFIDNERPYFTGKIGLYNEDAHVQFDDIIVKDLVTPPTPAVITK